MDLPPCNFRPVLPKLDSNQKPNIYRSNSLDDGTVNTCMWLYETVGVKTYVDLREFREFHPESKLSQVYTMTNSNTFKSSKRDKAENCGYMFHIRFITFVYYLKVVVFRLSWSQLYNVLRLLVRHLFYRDYEYQRYGGGCYINPLSIGDFYCLLLEDCRSIFGNLFSLMVRKEYFPMIICCTLGKDRTGIVAAIVMQLVGCSNEEIVQEYSASDTLLSSMKDQIHVFFQQRGVDEHFEGSPAHAMEKMLQYLKTKHGGAEGYLNYCGLTQSDIDAIKRNVQHRTIESTE